LRDKEFCVNFVGENYLSNCWKSIHEHDYHADEIVSAGFTSEKSATIKSPRIKESFLKMEYEYMWEKELFEGSTNITICGKLKHISIAESFLQQPTSEKYTDNTFMFNLHNPINPLTGEHLGGGVGSIKYIHEM
jgi:flavin reductase (DIM6/NTAB) family NADH-FMN oxidoreductase RutF